MLKVALKAVHKTMILLPAVALLVVELVVVAAEIIVEAVVLLVVVLIALTLVQDFVLKGVLLHVLALVT